MVFSRFGIDIDAPVPLDGGVLANHIQTYFAGDFFSGFNVPTGQYVSVPYTAVVNLITGELVMANAQNTTPTAIVSAVQEISTGGAIGPLTPLIHNQSDAEEWCDPDTDLCWELQTHEDEVMYNAYAGRCNNLVLAGSSNWRTPTIDELRTLVKGCPGTESGGPCPVTEGSSEADVTADCTSCLGANGENPLGCYLPDDFFGTCSITWSTTSVVGGGGAKFTLDFYTGDIHYQNYTYAMSRCVRDAG